MTASIAPTTVISLPLTSHDRPVMIVLAAPTAKCATRLMPAAQMTAVIPPKKKNGMIGMNAPRPVETIAESAATSGLGNACWFRPSSSCASAFKNCSGCLLRRSASVSDSSSLKPLSW